jgi:hypothetical protein
MAYRSVNYVSNGWTNYNIPGPLGTQFASPFGDPYRVQGTGGIFDVVGSIASGIGKVITPLLPVAVPVAGAVLPGLLTKSPTPPQQAPQQSQFTVAAQTADAQVRSAAAEKSNQTIYIIAGGAALVALLYFLSRRK